MKRAWARENKDASVENARAAEQAMHLTVENMLQANASGIAESQMTLPFPVHPSHTAVYVGGFAACLKCGSARSCDHKNNALRKACRGWCPRGTRATLARTLQGKHPNGQEGKWPDGSTSPEVFKLPAEAYGF